MMQTSISNIRDGSEVDMTLIDSPSRYILSMHTQGNQVLRICCMYSSTLARNS
jgi:hypothetical protein